MLASAFLKRALATVLAVAAPRFLISGIAQLTGNQTLSRAGAVLGFLLAAVAMYTAFALLMEDSRGHEVLPTGRQGAAREVIHATLDAELRNIERQGRRPPHSMNTSKTIGRCPGLLRSGRHPTAEPVGRADTGDLVDSLGYHLHGCKAARSAHSLISS